MIWNIEEKVEDAFIAYLQSQRMPDLLVHPRWRSGQIKYPCVLVNAEGSTLVSKSARFTKTRKVSLLITIATERKDESQGRTVTRTMRDIHSQFKEYVLEALSVADDLAAPAHLVDRADAIDIPTGLAGQVNGADVPFIWIKSAVVGDIVRFQNEEQQTLETTVMIDVIAMPLGV